MKIILTLVFALSVLLSAEAVMIETVRIGDLGNSADSTGFGSVNYSYRMGKYEVTNAQYAEFLNAVAASDPYRLWEEEGLMTSQWEGIIRSGSPGNYTYSVKPDAVGQGPGRSDYTYGDKPVSFVSFYSAIRFANWLHNGQGDGDTETGAYTLLPPVNSEGVPFDGAVIMRNPNARWFIPSEVEWYKAAYYDADRGVYYDYATGSDILPDNNPPSADTGNSANYFDRTYTTSRNYPFTSVGAYALSASPYGTFDQAGNIAEWTEARSHTIRYLRGGYFAADYRSLPSTFRHTAEASAKALGIGFRIATVIPEPTTSVQYVIATLAAICVWRKRGIGSPPTRA